MTNSASSSQCQAIAVSTGQQCTKSGKLDGFCSEKHKQQGTAAPVKGAGRRRSSATPSADDSDGSFSSTSGTKKSSSKTTKALKAIGLEKSDDGIQKSAKVSKKKAPAKRQAAKVARKKASAVAKGDESDDAFVASDEDYEPEDTDEEFSDDFEDASDDDSDDDDDEDDDVGELTGKMASVKIKADDPTLPPRPNDASATAAAKRKQKELKKKVKKNSSKIFNTDKILPPPKSKTKATTVPGKGAVGGFWVPAPSPVKLPESTLKALEAVKDKFKSSNEKTSSGTFSYRTQFLTFLHLDNDKESLHGAAADEHDPESKRAQVRKFLGGLFKSKHANPERPLPALPATGSGEDSKEAHKKPKAPRRRRGSQGSVDSITQDIQDLSVKSSDSLVPDDEEDDLEPNQCRGFNSNGHRCKRKVKLDRPMAKGEVLMCHTHEVDDDDEVVVHIEGKGGVLLQWLDVSVWVNPNLPDFIQNKLRKAMERPVSATDKPGYIYSYQLLETRTDKTHTYFKVGRTDNVHRRMNEWGDKCGSPPILIEVFPEQGSLAPKSESDLKDAPPSPTSSPSSTDITGLRCRYSHRVERLIHIELKPFHDADHVCKCNTNHREWFKVPHKPGVKNEEKQIDQAWQQIRVVIVHWMSYMERVYGPG